MAITIEVQGLEALIEALDAYPEFGPRILQDSAEDALRELRDPLSDYPAPVGEYDRTGDLGRGWDESVSEFAAVGSGFEASIGNPTPYGPYVQDDERQAWMHRGRWSTVGMILRDNAPNIEAHFQGALEEIVKEIERRAGG